MGRATVLSGLLVGLSAVAAVGCNPFAAEGFSCKVDTDCGADGRCEEITNFCSFPDEGCGPGGRRYGEYSGPKAGQCATGDILPIIDAPIDSPPPPTCEANTKTCFGNAIETCRADGQGFDMTKRFPCALTCDENGGNPRCLAATGIPIDEQLACGNGTDGALDLQAQSTSVIRIRDTEITCTGCAGNVTSIPRRGTTPNNWYCLKTLILPAGVDFDTDNGVGPITLFVAGQTQIDATIDFVGRGPGSLDGANRAGNDAAGNPGNGPCRGEGGAIAGTGATAVGGGGGGAGGAGRGGNGGDGNGAMGATANGGNGAQTSTQCDSATVTPLRGGSGGGGGGDGACGPGGNSACAGGGGDGGGAIHIATRAILAGNGSINVSGEDGESTIKGGGGGGGAGGAVLLESPMLMLAGQLRTRGGAGGAAGIVPGGGGANNGLDGQGGVDGLSDGDGGGGGGGAAGRVRINTTISQPSACSNVQPTPSCTTGTLPIQP